ncbi:MAG: hypothetical protein H8D26_00680 [Methanomicrobia archaeon]|nr:hypothetical protein [Methanomicrobia archaeon]
MIHIGEEESVPITVTITYCAKITVSPSTFINFETVGSKNLPPPKTITISEEYGYKTLYDVRIKRKSGNDWVTASPNKDNITVSREIRPEITFTLEPKYFDYERADNSYTWRFTIESDSENVESATITVEARIMRPPKLGRLDDEDLEIKFDKPKGTVSKYDRYIDAPVRNRGDEPMRFSSSVSKSPGGGIDILNPSPGVVSNRGSENIKVHIIAPYNAPEGTYYGRLHIYAKDGDDKKVGEGYVDITIKIIWPVDFTISPTSIDFGSIELKDREYEKKSVIITLTEFYLYKPVRNLRLSKSGEYGNWLKEERAFVEIPPGASRNITLKIEPGLEAVPKDYSWKYDISASEISAKRMEVKANIIPLNITKLIEGFKSFRGTPLYSNYPSSEDIISNGVEMLEAVERSEIGAEDWKKIPILMKGTLSLLSSLNDGIISSEAKNYGKAVESLWTASVSTSTIESNSELNNWDISGYAKDISAGADKTTEEVLMDEAKMLENRGWDIKKAVEHAMALDDISGLKEEENVLESALSYQYAATIYGPGLLNDKEKRLECTYEESRMMDKHDELVSDATDLRIKAENNISNSKENDLIRIRIGDTYLLLNPYKYDTFSANYGSAERYMEDASKKYKVAGEPVMAGNTKEALNKLKSERRYILSLFFLACILYAAAFIYAINRVIMGTVAYMRDMYEREVGDIVIT